MATLARRGRLFLVHADSPAESIPREYWCTIVDTVTHRQVDWSAERHDASWWTRGNGSCDCNRADAFNDEALEEAMIAAQRAAPPELQDWQAYCYGAARFLVVDVHGDVSPEERAVFMREVNADYPEALR